jgi:arabinose-5-phosphate isomerase
MSTMSETLNDIHLAEGRRVIQEEIYALQRTYGKLGESFSRSVDIMAASGKVIVSGIGKSGIIGRKIVATLVSTGKRAVFLHPVEALHGDIGIVEPGDCALLLSKSGNTAELIKLLPSLKARQTSIIAILGANDSPLGKLSDVVLDASVEREACPLNAAPMSSTTVALVLGDALAAALMKHHNFSVGQFASFHPLGQLGRNISLRVEEVMHKEEQLPVLSPTASFRDVLIEITAKGLGCVCVVDENQTLAGIVTDGDIRRTLQQYDDISSLKAIDIQTRNPVTVAPDALVGEALSLMENREHQIGVLPVVTASGVCVGVVRVHDIVRVGI